MKTFIVSPNRDKYNSYIVKNKELINSIYLTETYQLHGRVNDIIILLNNWENNHIVNTNPLCNLDWFIKSGRFIIKREENK